MSPYGPQTEMALQNFPFPLPRVSLSLIYALAEVKKAAALANEHTKELNRARSGAIVTACNEILAGRHDEAFVTPAVQGGAGTSINMNVNEVIAIRASAILKENGIDQHVDANDHVNMSQSTNDANPTALRIAAIRGTDRLKRSLVVLRRQFRKQGERYRSTYRLARTHIQDAVPTTYGATFLAYAATVERDIARLETVMPFLHQMNLGGTAVGNGINASKEYQIGVYENLREITGLPVEQAGNMIALTGGAGDLCHLSAMLAVLAQDLSKIATDLRFLSSGPQGGIGEISLVALQPGSSIMPGKVNPVMPESINQIAFFVAGKNLTVHQASEASHLELALMFPVIADAILTSLDLLIAGVEAFSEKCIATLSVREDRTRENLESSTAYATLFAPRLGYAATSALVKQSLEEKVPFLDILERDGIMSREESEAVIREQIPDAL
jgi:aspartate ammonia-lyase